MCARSFLLDETLSVPIKLDLGLVYTIHDKASKRGKPLLYRSDGYTYGIKSTKESSIVWICTSRPTKNPCGATVKQTGDEALYFELGISGWALHQFNFQFQFIQYFYYIGLL